MKKCKYKNKIGIVKKKPKIVSYYNKVKSGADLADMEISVYHTKEKPKNGGNPYFFIY